VTAIGFLLESLIVRRCALIGNSSEIRLYFIKRKHLDLHEAGVSNAAFVFDMLLGFSKDWHSLLKDMPLVFLKQVAPKW
jgi:hypothetical protein